MTAGLVSTPLRAAPEDAATGHPQRRATRATVSFFQQALNRDARHEDVTGLPGQGPSRGGKHRQEHRAEGALVGNAASETRERETDRLESGHVAACRCLGA